MIFKLRIVLKYFRYLIGSRNRHAVHSPFVYTLLEDVFRDKRKYYAFADIEKRRAELLSDTRVIEVTDLGAGSAGQRGAERRVSEIVRHAAKPPKYGRLLFRLAQYFAPATILELGTSLGLSTAYLASGAASAGVITLEGCPEIARIAQDNFELLGLGRIRLITGHFDDTLGPALLGLKKLDMAFIDGNHRKEPTLRYFSQCLTRTHPGSVLIFDDIHWTAEMESAWNEIMAHPAVTLSIDLFFLGLVFFREEFHEKQHFVLRY